jgi:microcompartment protein CcmK/EutM
VSQATVVGEVWATRKAPGLAGRKLLLLAMEGEDRLVVAVDTLDARRGESVLVSWGSGARNVLEAGPDNRQILADAALSLVIDGRSDRSEEGG